MHTHLNAPEGKKSNRQITPAAQVSTFLLKVSFKVEKPRRAVASCLLSPSLSAEGLGTSSGQGGTGLPPPLPLLFLPPRLSCTRSPGRTVAVPEGCWRGCCCRGQVWSLPVEERRQIPLTHSKPGQLLPLFSKSSLGGIFYFPHHHLAEFPTLLEAVAGRVRFSRDKMPVPAVVATGKMFLTPGGR